LPLLYTAVTTEVGMGDLHGVKVKISIAFKCTSGTWISGQAL